MISVTRVMCRDHWALVPKELRMEIVRHYQPDDKVSRQLKDAVIAAIDAVDAKEQALGD